VPEPALLPHHDPEPEPDPASYTPDFDADPDPDDADTEVELDEEVDTILTAVTALDALAPPAQRRVLTYLADRYLFAEREPHIPADEPRRLRSAD